MENYGNDTKEISLDIYIKRTQYGLYQDAIQLCITNDEDKWKKAIFWVFDAPEMADKPFEVIPNSWFCYSHFIQGENRVFEGYGKEVFLVCAGC
jgi:hypothetical protein